MSGLDNLAAERFGELWPILSKDAEKAIKIADKAPNQFNRRNAVRAVFASIEGAVYLTKNLVIATLPQCRGFFDEAEIALLREKRYSLNSKGQAYAQPNFLRTDENFRFAMDMLMRGIPTELDFDTNGSGWKSFKDSLSVRHRVTHPKSMNDLNINDIEFDKLKKAFNWAFSTITHNMARAVLAMIDKQENNTKLSNVRDNDKN